jgi:hypothetical protein
MLGSVVDWYDQGMVGGQFKRGTSEDCAPARPEAKIAKRGM